MKRREILQRRRYAACPKATLARTDLTASAKVVYTTLIGQLFSEEADRAELSTVDIAAKAGIGQRTVRQALRDLEAAGLIASHHAPGAASLYTFPACDTEQLMATPPRPNPPTSPAESAGVPDAQPRPNPPTAPADSAQPPATSADPHKEVNDLERFSEQPPLPPNGERDDSPPPTKAKAINALAAAYLEATGRAMPDAWSRDAGREYDNGDRAILAEIDAATIRRGLAFAEKRGLAFAFRTLVLAIHQRPLIDPCEAANVQKAEQAEAVAETIAQLEAEHNGRLQDKRHAAMAYFQTLDEPTRQHYLRQAAALPAVDQCGPDGLEILAAVRAYNNRPSPERKHA